MSSCVPLSHSSTHTLSKADLKIAMEFVLMLKAVYTFSLSGINMFIPLISARASILVTSSNQFPYITETQLTLLTDSWTEKASNFKFESTQSKSSQRQGLRLKYRVCLLTECPYETELVPEPAHLDGLEAQA